MNIAVVGCGNISRVHFAAIEQTPSLSVCAVCDIKADRAKRYAEKYGVKAYESFDDLLANENPDAVHICTPHYLHTPFAVKALKKGINVLTEKPCSMTVNEVEQLRLAQKESGKAVGVCFQNRYNDCVRYVRHIIESGEMGSVVSVRAFVTWDRGADYYSDDWHGTLEKEGGGLLINQAIHTVDLMRCFGGGCSALTAHVANDHLKGIIEVEDTATMLLEFENAGGVFYGTTAFTGNAPVLIDVQLEKGLFRLEGEKLYYIGKNREITLVGDEQEKEFLGKSYWGTGHAALINDFYECIEKETPFEIDAFEGGEAVKIVLGAYESSNLGERIEL